MVASMTHMQFQREIQKRGIDQQTGFLLSVLFEAQLEQGKQLDSCATILQEVVGTVESFTRLHEATQGKLTQLMRELNQEVPGVSVVSEPGQGN